MSLATLADVEKLSGRPLPPAEAAAAQALIPLFTAELATLTNRPLSAKVVVGELAPVVDGYALLTYAPVASVQAVRYLPPSTSLYTGTSTILGGRVYFEGLAGCMEQFAFDYTANLPATSPQFTTIKSLLLARVLRALAKVKGDAVGVQSLTQEGYSSAYMEGWTEQELAAIERVRRPVLV